VAWGWVEMSFLMGFITGPRRTDCPPGAKGWRRTQFAIEAILYHEFAIITVAGLLALLSWKLPNQVCLKTFFVLWVLRLSAKLNVFLGVRNLGEEFLPEHLRYLQTYFSRKAMNLLFPFSVTAATITAALLWKGAISAPDHSFGSLQDTFLATLLTLAVVEHWLLILPIPASSALWSWGFSSRHGGEAADTPQPPPSRSANIAVAPAAAASVGL
jgi:putative photosynthetic complex assembly protein 2